MANLTTLLISLLSIILINPLQQIINLEHYNYQPSEN